MTNATVPEHDELDTEGTTPHRIGRYVLIERIGAGAMGSVHAAYDPVLARTVAIKLLHDERSGAELRLLREAQAMAKLAHPHVVAVYDAGTLDGRVWLAMERVEGRTLRAWLAEPKSDAEIVEVFAQAAEALAAVHRVGIVHRDFKPDNVLVDAALQISGGDALADSGRVTRSGSVRGTPAYMSPEQFRGEVVDAASDQFSFCVTLFEATFGERPFAGDNRRAIAMAVLHGTASEAKPRSRAQAAIAMICKRGLARDPAQRWPTMDDVLHELRALQQGRRRRVQGMAALGVAGALATGWVLRPQGQQPCTQSATKAAAVWAEPRADAIQAAIADGRPWAAGAAAWVRGSIDAWTTSWIDAHTQACRATAIDGTQSAELLDLRMACFDRRLVELDGIARALEEPDAKVVARIHEVVAQLPVLARCDDVDALRRGAPAPSPEIADAVQRAEVELATIRAEIDTGALARADAALGELEATAARLDYPPLALDVQLERARLYREHSRAEAEPTFDALLTGAIAQHDDELAATAARELGFLVGVQLGRHAEGRRALALAAAFDREGRRARSLLLTRAQIEFAAGEYVRAQALIDEGLALADPSPAGAPLRGRMHNTAGAIALRAGRYADAKDELLAAVDTLASAFGADHPELARSYNNLALAYERLGDLPHAIATLDRSRRITTQAFGPEDPLLGQILGNLAAFHELAGEPAPAREEATAALVILERKLGPSDPRMSAVLTVQGRAALALGDLDAADAALARSIVLRSAAMGASHPDLALPLTARAMVELARGKHDAALRTTHEALALVANATFDAGDRAELLLVHARALAALGRNDESAAALAAAAGLLAATGPSGDRLRKQLATLLH